MSAREEPPEEEVVPERGEHISFVQRLHSHFGREVDPEINLQAEEDEISSAAGLDRDEDDSGSSGPTGQLVQQLSDQHSLGARYRVKREIARGGMGTILRVWDDDLRRNLAMKVMHGQSAIQEDSGSSEIDQEKLGRFLEEAQITGQLDHPGIVPVHDLGIDDRGRCYFTMRLVRGRELKEILDCAREGKEGWTRTKALNLILKVCEAMAYAHSKGVVHRDLKPSNIMVGRFGEVYVMDWGLARVIGRRDSHDLRLRAPEDASAMSLVRTVRKEESELNPESPLVTMDGDVVGTPSYMALEQAQGKLDQVGARSDVYSLGAILYYMLTGKAPYVKPGERVSPHTVLNRVLQDPPKPVSKLAKDEPAELLAICEKAMERDSKRRYASMLEVADDIQAYLENRVVSAYEGGSLAEFRKWMARNRGMAAGVAGMVTLSIASALGFAYQKQRQVDQLNEEQSETAQARQDAVDALSEAETAREDAEQSAVVAAENEQAALRSSYLGNITAADFSLKLHDVQEARVRLRNTDRVLRGWEWEHLDFKAHPALRSFGRIWVGGIDRVVFSPDGERILSLGRGGGIRVNDVETGGEIDVEGLAVVIPPSNTGVGFRHLFPLRMDQTADGSRIAIVGHNERIEIFDVDSGKRAIGLPGKGVRGHDSRVGAVAFSRDGRFLVSGADNGSLILWDGNGKIVDRLPPHPGRITDVAWSPNSKLFATASSDGSVRVWDSSLGQTMQRDDLRGHKGEVNRLVWDATGERLFSAGSDRAINHWNVETGRLVSTLSGHEEAVLSLDYDPGRERLVSGSEDKTVRVWDVTTGEAVVMSGHAAPVYDAVFSPDGMQVVSCAYDGEVLLWDARGDLSTTDLQLAGGGSGTQGIETVAFHPDGERIATGGGDFELVLWDSLSGEPLRRLRGHGHEGEENSQATQINSVAFSPDGLWVYSAADDGTVRRWDVETGAERNVYRHGDRVTAIAVTPDGSRLITAAGDNLVRVLDAETGDELRRLKGHRRPPTAIAVSPDGLHFATSGRGVHLWTLRDPETVQVFDNPSLCLAVGFSPDGSRLAASTSRGEVVVWDVETKAELLSVRDELRARAVVFTPDGKRLISGAGDGSLRVRDVDDGDTLLLLGWPIGNGWAEVSALAFSPDGQRLLAGSKEGIARIFETGGVEERRERWLESRQLREQAAPIVTRLFDERFYLDDVVLQLQRDPELSAKLRQTAIRLANLRGDDQDMLAGKSMEEALVPGNTHDTYERARRRALAARNMGNSVRIQLVLGMAQYRVGNVSDASRTLERVSLMGADGLSTREETIRLLFLAMAQFREGLSTDANGSLSRANASIREDPTLAYNRDIRMLLDEAEALILNPPGG